MVEKEGGSSFSFFTKNTVRSSAEPERAIDDLDEEMEEENGYGCLGNSIPGRGKHSGGSHLIGAEAHKGRDGHTCRHLTGYQ